MNRGIRQYTSLCAKWGHFISGGCEIIKTEIARGVLCVFSGTCDDGKF